MEQQPVSLWKSSLTYGLFLGIALVLVSVIFYATGNTFARSAQFISYGVMIAGIVIAQLQFRKSQGDVMTYAQALGVGVLTMLFASVITGFFTYLLYAIIDPSLQDQLKLSVEEQIVKQGRVSEDQLAAAVEMASKFQTPPMMFIMGIFGGTFIGLIISLLTSIFTQRKPSVDFEE
jgi:formate/nitrite transporter FocA (FNT family)